MKFKLFLSAILCFSLISAFPQKIFMTGDSHVSGKIYPEEVKEIVEKVHPGIDFSFNAKVGAGFYTFNESEELMEAIFEARPDILIVHLGTNGSYAMKFDPDKCKADMTTFHGNVRGELPDCKIVYVTPFYNKNRTSSTTRVPVRKKKKGKTTYRNKTVYGPWKLNPKTRECADVIVKFANSHPDTYVIDNNADAGTEFLDQPGLIRPDHVHLTVDGYKLLGQQVGEKLLAISELWDNTEK